MNLGVAALARGGPSVLPTGKGGASGYSAPTNRGSIPWTSTGVHEKPPRRLQPTGDTTPRRRRSEMHSESITKRFWAKVDTSGGPDACWEWQAYRMPLGYGQMNVGGRKGSAHLAHRLAWEIVRGPIPEGIEVCHNCPDGDNSACVNPAHLFLGTHAENMADMGHKGKAGPLEPCRGVRHPAARLSEQDVRAIRAAVSSGESCPSVATRYGMCRSTIQKIANGKLWGHLDDAA